MSRFDLIVLGGGSGGVRAARIAATHGAHVALIEKERIGGTCVHAGCIPKKLLVFAAQHARALRRAERYGFARAEPPAHSWEGLLRAVHEQTTRLGELYERNLLAAGVEVLRGTARLAGAGSVELDGQVLNAEHIVIASGAHAFVPDIPGRELALTSDDVFHLERMPERVVIAGGGYIALELASVLAALGAEITIAQRGPCLLTGFDRDLSEHIAAELTLQGVEVLLNARAAAISDQGTRVTLDSGRVLECDAALFATGRLPNVGDLGLERAGVVLGESGGIAVDAYQATNVKGIYAVGDVTGRLQLTPVAIAEGHALADSLFGGVRRSVHERVVPTAVFCEPELASAGETERAARARGVELDIYRNDFRPLEHALDASGSRALVKLVVERSTQRLLGCHIAAPHAAEIIQGFAAAMTAGVTKPQLDATIGLHPTVAEELVTLRRPVPDA